MFSTHNMDQAESLCESVCIIAQGAKVLDGSLQEIRRRHAGHKYRVEFDTVTPEVLSVMEGEDPVLRRAARSGNAWEMDLPDPADIRRALTGLAAADVHVSKFEHIRPSLHEIFVDHVGQAKVAERRPEATHA